MRKAWQERALFWLVRTAVGAFGRLGFAALHRLSDVLYVLFYRVFGYRRRVVRDNLARAFPEWDAGARRRIERDFYRHLCDVLLESIKGFSMGEAELAERFRFDNPEAVAPFFEAGQNVIAVGSHIGNWEWGGMIVDRAVGADIVGVYKTIRNPWLDAYVRERRGRYGMHLVDMGRAGRLMLQKGGRPAIFLLLSDQNPAQDTGHWQPFLGQETCCINGPEQFARRRNLPVLYMSVRKDARSRYTMRFELLCERAAELPAGELTRRYMALLEADIRRAPAYWLWSHRRWKRRRPEGTALLPA